MAKPTKAEKDFHLDVMSQGCCVCGIDSVFHHVTRKPVCGTLAKPGARRDHKWGAALCDFHHGQFHNVLGNVDSFNEAHGVDLDVEAEKNYNLYGWDE